MTEIDQNKKKSRRKLIVIFSLYIGPFIAAALWFGYVKTNAANMGNQAKGDLLQPTYSLQAFDAQQRDGERFRLDNLQGKWTLLNLQTGDCAEPCSKTLYNLRQLRYSFGKDAGRIGRVTVFVGGTISDKLMATQPKLIAVDSQIEGLLEQLRRADGQLPPCDACIYLIDPFANAVLRFNKDIKLKDLSKDLKRLLKNSRIG